MKNQLIIIFLVSLLLFFSMKCSPTQEELEEIDYYSDMLSSSRPGGNSGVFKDKSVDPSNTRRKIRMIRKFVKSVLEELDFGEVFIDRKVKKASLMNLISCMSIFTKIGRGKLSSKDLIKISPLLDIKKKMLLEYMKHTDNLDHTVRFIKKTIYKGHTSSSD